MSLVFEDPPQGEGPGLRFRERSQERKEMDDLLSQLSGYPEQWARLYDFPEDGKEDANKMAGKVRSAAGYLGTGHGWSVAVRSTGQGWSVFAKMSNEPPRKRGPRSKPQDQDNNGANASQSTPVAQQAQDEAQERREPTFQ